MRDLHWTLIYCAVIPLVGLVVMLSPLGLAAMAWVARLAALLLGGAQ